MLAIGSEFGKDELSLLFLLRKLVFISGGLIIDFSKETLNYVVIKLFCLKKDEF